MRVLNLNILRPCGGLVTDLECKSFIMAEKSIDIGCITLYTFNIIVVKNGNNFYFCLKAGNLKFRERLWKLQGQVYECKNYRNRQLYAGACGNQ